MIARIWHGRVPAAKGDAYLEHMRTFAIPRYRAVPGNLAAYALRRFEGDVVHIDMLTFWESLESIKAFAGEDVEKARYDDFDKDFLLEYEPTCRHYEGSKSNVPTLPPLPRHRGLEPGSIVEALVRRRNGPGSRCAWPG